MRSEGPLDFLFPLAQTSFFAGLLLPLIAPLLLLIVLLFFILVFNRHSMFVGYTILSILGLAVCHLFDLIARFSFFTFFGSPAPLFFVFVAVPISRLVTIFAPH